MDKYMDNAINLSQMIARRSNHPVAEYFILKKFYIGISNYPLLTTPYKATDKELRDTEWHHLNICSVDFPLKSEL